MKLTTLLLAGLVTLAPAAALAQAPGADGDVYNHGARKALRQKMIEQFDADGDGRLTGPEKQRAKQALKKLKKQKAKQKLKRAKRHAHAKRAKQARRAERRAARFDRMIQRLDANGDGVIGPAEAGDRFERLKRFDADGDGWVSRDEFVAGKR